MTMLARCLTALALGAAVIVLSPGSAAAAPQILAVAQSDQPLEFRCEDGVCEVEMSAMCLQEARRYPDSQTVYKPFDDQSFTLVVRADDGTERRIVAGDNVTIRSKRSFTAIRITMAEETLAALGGTNAAVHVSGGASLVPEAVAGDFYPQTEADIARATGPLRQLAAGWLDAGGDRAQASRLLSAAINAMPHDFKSSEAVYEAAWTEAESGKATAMTDEALAKARLIYDRCHQTAIYGNYRQCLEKGHDSMMYRMNIEYWDAVKTGS
ncbi:MAG: hypothetical protein RIC16_04280 [Rhodospirillales bacterium]